MSPSCVLLMAALLTVLRWEITSATTTPTTVKTPAKTVLCEEPRVDNGLVLSHNGTYVAGSKAEIMCYAGYRAHHTKSQVIHLLCTNHQWVNVLNQSSPVPTCQRNISCPLPEIENGVVVSRQGGYLPGDTAPIICKPGNAIRPPRRSLLQCHQDGQWRTMKGDEELPRCQGLCEKPEELRHGNYNILDAVVAVEGMVPDGTKIFYYCDQGYTLGTPDSAIAICQAGIWIGKPARCIKRSAIAPCPDPPTVIHAYYSMYDAKGPDAAANIVIYFCSSGYKIMGEKTMRCENGAWVGEMPRCMPRGECGQPPTVDHGDYRYYTGTPDHHNIGGVADGAQVYYQCFNGYRLKGQPILVCKEGEWLGNIPVCETRTECDPPMDVRNGNWMFDNYLPYPDYRIGTRLLYECEENYKPIGSTQIECLSSGYWSDYAPRCLPQSEYCSEPAPIEHGLYMCVKPSTCGLFHVGTEVHYLCYSQYESRPDDVLVQTCVVGGKWTGRKPVCQPVELTNYSDQHLDINSSTITVVIATSCSVLGLLLVVMVIVVLQRRVKPRGSGGGSSSGVMAGMPPPPPPYAHNPDTEVPRTATDEHDRVALIQFADGVQVVLPSYEEAVRGPTGGRHPPRLSRFNSDSSHGSQRSRGEYRPLPSIPPSLRTPQSQQQQQQQQQPSPSERDHHRNSIITTTSTTTRDNLSLAFGSMDTVNVSDGTSTSITIGTYDSGASNPSIATSQRAAAGSLTSSHASLVNEDAPLIERTPTADAPPDNAVTTPIDEELDKE